MVRLVIFIVAFVVMIIFPASVNLWESSFFDGYIDDTVKLAFYTQAFLIMSVVLFLSVLWLLYRLNKKDEEISQYIELTEDLKVTIYKRDHQIKSTVQENLTNERNRNMEDHVAELFENQYRLLDKLCNTYYETHGSNRDRDAVYTMVKSEMNKFVKDTKSIKELENIVDIYKGNIMTLARQELVSLSEQDFRLLLFWLVGFSAKTISVFTGDSTGNIYVKKSRLKNTLSYLGTPVSLKLLEYIS